jgi:hypothetical protein
MWALTWPRGRSGARRPHTAGAARSATPPRPGSAATRCRPAADPGDPGRRLPPDAWRAWLPLAAHPAASGAGGYQRTRAGTMGSDEPQISTTPPPDLGRRNRMDQSSSLSTRLPRALRRLAREAVVQVVAGNAPQRPNGPPKPPPPAGPCRYFQASPYAARPRCSVGARPTNRRARSSVRRRNSTIRTMLPPTHGTARTDAPIIRLAGKKTTTPEPGLALRAQEPSPRVLGRRVPRTRPEPGTVTTPGARSTGRSGRQRAPAEHQTVGQRPHDPFAILDVQEARSSIPAAEVASLGRRTPESMPQGSGAPDPAIGLGPTCAPSRSRRIRAIASPRRRARSSTFPLPAQPRRGRRPRLLDQDPQPPIGNAIGALGTPRRAVELTTDAPLLLGRPPGR